MIVWWLYTPKGCVKKAFWVTIIHRSRKSSLVKSMNKIGRFLFFDISPSHHRRVFCIAHTDLDNVCLQLKLASSKRFPSSQNVVYPENTGWPTCGLPQLCSVCFFCSNFFVHEKGSKKKRITSKLTRVMAFFPGKTIVVLEISFFINISWWPILLDFPKQIGTKERAAYSTCVQVPRQHRKLLTFSDMFKVGILWWFPYFPSKSTESQNVSERGFFGGNPLAACRCQVGTKWRDLFPGHHGANLSFGCNSEGFA